MSLYAILMQTPVDVTCIYTNVQVNVYVGKQLVDSCTFTIPVLPLISPLRLIDVSSSGVVGKTATFRVSLSFVALIIIIKMEEKLLYGGPIGTHQRSFERYHPRPPTASPCVGIAMDRPQFLGYPLLSQDRVKLRTLNFVGTFTR